MSSPPQRAQRSDGLIGRVMLGRYRIVCELARGGMGVVYLARGEGAGGFVKPVVVKLVLPQHMQDPRMLGMFVREAQILSDLRHPNIVGVLDFGQEGEAHVMVLEYIRGHHLGQWSKYLHKSKRPIPTDVVLLWIIDVLEALHKAHSARHPDGTSMHIVHRDVSPSNILLDEDGRARLLDFGVARMRGGNVDYQTQIQSFVGKFSYGAPELLTGVDASPQSDLYSCAVVLHELLFGRNTFLASEDAVTLSRVASHIPEAIEPLRADAPRGIDAVLQKALHKKPTQRYPNAWEFACALRALLPRQEDDLRGRIATMLKADFGPEMAKALGIESLAERDQAWREYGNLAEPAERTMMLDLDGIDGSEGMTHADPESHVRATNRNPSRPRGSIMNTGRLSIPEPPKAHIAAPPLPSKPRPKALLQWLAPLVVVGCLVATALYLALRPASPQTQAQRVIHVEPPPDPQALAREQAAREEARIQAVIALRESAVSAHQDHLDECFTKKGKGKLSTELTFKVDESGKVADVALASAALDRSLLGKCLRSVAKRIRFPAPDAPESFSIKVRASTME